MNTSIFQGFGRLYKYLGSRDGDNSFIYEGWFVNGLPQGFGRKVLEDGSYEYIGEFKLGMEDGKGTSIDTILTGQDVQRVE